MRKAVYEKIQKKTSTEKELADRELMERNALELGKRESSRLNR